MAVDQLSDWLASHRSGMIIGLAAGLAVIAGLSLVRWLGRRAARGDPQGLSWRTVIGRALARTSAAFIVAAAADTFSTYAGLPRQVARVIDIAFVIAFALQGAIWARELILGLISRRVAEADGGSTLANATALIRLLVSVAVFALAIILILDNLGVNVTALIAGLGIGGIAIGLAAQGIFSDLFAALSILFDKPFKKGDTIRYDNTTGTVEHIGLKTTRIRSLSGEQRVMANTALLSREIQNLALAQARRITIYLAVAGRTSPDAVDAVGELAAQAVGCASGCRLVRCVLSGAGGGGLAYDLVYDDPSGDNDLLARNRSAVLRGLIDGLAEHKLELVRASDVPAPPAPL